PRAAQLSQQALTMRSAGRIFLHEQVDEVRHFRQPCVLRVAQITAVVPDRLQCVGLNRQQVKRDIRSTGLFLCHRGPSLTRSRGLRYPDPAPETSDRCRPEHSVTSLTSASASFYYPGSADVKCAAWLAGVRQV